MRDDSSGRRLPSMAMTEIEQKTRTAVQEAMDRRDNGGVTGH